MLMGTLADHLGEDREAGQSDGSAPTWTHVRERVHEIARCGLDREWRGRAMSLYYTHLMIPDHVGYAPRPGQVADFFAALIEIGAAPVNLKLQAQADFEPLTYARRKSWAAQFRTGTNPLTGEAVAIPRYTAEFGDVAGLREALCALQGLDEYEVSIFGSGPPKLPLFPLDTFVDGKSIRHHGPYDLAAGCCLEPEIVSTSGYDAPVPFRSFCSPTDRTGHFTNHRTGEAIRVPNAGCARFWIEFRFGKWVFPQMKDNTLDLLPASVVEAAQKAFAVRFAQGCCWG